MKILYFGFAQPHTSIDGIYLRGLRENGIEVIDYFFSQKSFMRYGQMFTESCGYFFYQSLLLLVAGYACMLVRGFGYGGKRASGNVF